MNPHATEAAPASATGRRAALTGFAGSDTGRAAGMAIGVGFMNVIALVFTVVFARVLGPSDYGSLAVLISAYVVLMVAGQALQIASARQVSHAIADGHADPARGVRTWIRHLLVATLVVAVVSIPLQPVIAAVLAVDETWAAAGVPVSAMAFAVVCVHRGVLQAFQRYRVVAVSLVGEATLRLLFALALVGAGLGVAGAFLGQLVALAGVGAALYLILGPGLPAARDGEGGLRELLRSSRAPVIGLTLLFLLQEAHVIVVKHVATGDAAGAYAVAAVAAKGIVWVAIGLGMFLLPEAARRARGGEDARRVLASTLGLSRWSRCRWSRSTRRPANRCCRAAFGDDLTGASGALPWLGIAMSLVARSYLCVQYLLALGRSDFIPVLGIGVVVDVALLASVGDDLTASRLRSPASRACVQLCLRASAPAPRMPSAARATNSCRSDARRGAGRPARPPAAAIARRGRRDGGVRVRVVLLSHGRDPVARAGGGRTGTAGGRPRHAAAGPVPCAASGSGPVRDRRAANRPGSDEDAELRSYRSGFWGLAEFGPGDAGPLRLGLRAVLDDGAVIEASLGEVEPDEVADPAVVDAPGPASEPLVAICMATYEPPPDLLRRQLDSMRAQTHANWVCVISDDCSTTERRRRWRPRWRTIRGSCSPARRGGAASTATSSARWGWPRPARGSSRSPTRTTSGTRTRSRRSWPRSATPGWCTATRA